MNLRFFLIAAAIAVPGSVLAADAIGQTEQQPTNWAAIAMFGGFVLLTLGG